MSKTANPANVAIFATLARDWWDPEGSSRLLHRVNPARMAYIRNVAIAHFRLDPQARHTLAGLTALDVGCGGGLVAEPLARMGAAVSGIDAGDDVIAVARDHATRQGLAIDYRAGDVLALEHAMPGSFDIVTCLEVVEHVDDVPAFLRALRGLLKPGGLLIFSTPNRTPLSWAVLIAGAERLTKLIPSGGHNWKQFLTPNELTQKMAAAGLRVAEIRGLSWSPAKGFHVGQDSSVNYIGTATPA